MGRKYFGKDLRWLVLLALLLIPACTRSATTPLPPKVATQTPFVIIETQVVEITSVSPSPVPTEIPTDVPETVSIFTDAEVTRYSYDDLAWCYENGYCESAEPVEGNSGPVSIRPEREMLVGDLYCSAVKFFHQDGEFEPVESTNLTFNDPGLYDHPDGARYAACAEEMARQLILHEHFLCVWPNVHLACPFGEASRTDGAIMIQSLAHTENLLYENEYKGSRLEWMPRSNVFPDVSPARGLTLTEVKASEALESDGIWQQRGGSMEFGAEQKLTMEVWAEWLHTIFELFGPPEPVPATSTLSPDSS